jgi:hypothetical protein
MTTTLAELKAEAARLNARIAELEGNNNRVTPPPVEERGVRVVELLPERTDSLPTLREMERLFTIVKQHSPWPQALNDRFDEHRPFRAFSSAFRWLQNVGRAERPNGKVALSYCVTRSDQVADHDQPCGNTHTDLQWSTGLQSAHCLDQLQPCPYRPLGVVLVGLRVAEIHQHTVAHELRYEAAEALHGLGYTLLIGRNDLA